MIPPSQQPVTGGAVDAHPRVTECGWAASGGFCGEVDTVCLSEIVVGYREGSSWTSDEYGRHHGDRKYGDHKLREREWQITQSARADETGAVSRARAVRHGVGRNPFGAQQDVPGAGLAGDVGLSSHLPGTTSPYLETEVVRDRVAGIAPAPQNAFRMVCRFTSSVSPTTAACADCYQKTARSVFQ